MTTSIDGDSDTQFEAGQSGRYNIREVVGRGGMATVYRAFDGVAEMDVALKVLHGHLADDKGMVEAFEREAALMQCLDHPGVVQVYGMVELDGNPAIAMELCEPGDLSARLARRGSFPQEEALEVVIAILEALGACHEEGVVHRDVKPHNVMFDAEGQPKIIDFGIGQAEELMAAEEAGQVGTVEYMAPERVDGLAVDGRSDIYSAGVMFFELLCGHVPYRADSASAVMRMHREAPVADPRAFEPGISDRVSEVVMRAMAKHPEERFDGVREMIAALRGQSHERVELSVPPRWHALEEQFGDDFIMGAPVDTMGYEWVVFVPPHLIDQGHEQDADYDRAIDALIEDYGQYFAFGEKGLGLRHGIYGASPPDLGGNASIIERSGHDILERFGIARGLSRRGVDVVLQDLDEAGVLARFARRPRPSRDEPRWKQRVSAMDVINIAVMLMCWIPILVVGLLVWMQPAPGSMAFIIPFVLACLFAGVATGWIGVSARFREWWLSRVSKSYLLDFSRNRAALGTESAVGERHFALFHEIESPRIAASYERALKMALHLRALLGESGSENVVAVVEGITDLTTTIAELELEVAAVRPGELSSHIRRLDRRIAATQGIEELEPLMEEKSALREQLTRRDAAQQRLQALAQRLHDLAANLEGLVRRYGPDCDEEIDDTRDVEITLDFDEVSEKFKALEKMAMVHRSE